MIYEAGRVIMLVGGTVAALGAVLFGRERSTVGVGLFMLAVVACGWLAYGFERATW